nr:immunoglobulin heavy chain junction region [Macaca mulatta]MPN83330.1 immunoglobulin heavy chain junction region [Macaca mulatta]
CARSWRQLEYFDYW